MSGTLILVESPSKAKSIQGYLGQGYVVRASVGHICDLPAKEYGVDLETFEETYVIRNEKIVSELRGLVKRHNRVILATDPDREGEAIAWHLARELKLNLQTVERAEFHEITPDYVRRALNQTRKISLPLVDAQRARRVLDRIVGFDVSKEICWPAGAKSAGRVQTPALHILCERERAILSFVPEKYWTLSLLYEEGFRAFVPDVTEESASTRNGDDAADSDVDDTQQEKKRFNQRRFKTREEAAAVMAEAQKHPHVVRDINRKRDKKRPEPPYTTSTVLQDASRKLRLSAAQTSDLLQKLYEAGYVTYIRTDSTRLSPEAVSMARDYIARVKPDALPTTPPQQRIKAGAQNAHEAIRPTRLTGDDNPPAEAAALYAMIKARFLASQAKPAEIERTTIQVSSGPVDWVAEGSVLIDPGYLFFWGPYAKQEDELLPAVQAGQRLTPKEWLLEDKQTSPPSRYDTGSFIKKLESSGIGRPSTYKAIVATLLERGYVEERVAGRGKSVLQPTSFGLVVDELLSETMSDLVDTDYTAAMEAALDRIEAQDGLTRLSYLQEWYAAFRLRLKDALPKAEAYRKKHNLKATPSGTLQGEETNKKCDRCGLANYIKIQRKVGRGSFLKCPSCQMMRNVQAKVKPAACPQCGSALIERTNPSTNGKFFGCVRWGAAENPCNYTEQEEGKPGGRYKREETQKTCPKCRKQKLVILTPLQDANQKPFYACTRECGFVLTVGYLRRKEPCPECGYDVFERHRRPTPEQKAMGQGGDPFWSCVRYPECKYAQDWSPVDDRSSSRS